LKEVEEKKEKKKEESKRKRNILRRTRQGTGGYEGGEGEKDTQEEKRRCWYLVCHYVLQYI
jgi:hypothetical protein